MNDTPIITEHPDAPIIRRLLAAKLELWDALTAAEHHFRVDIDDTEALNHIAAGYESADAVTDEELQSHRDYLLEGCEPWGPDEN